MKRRVSDMRAILTLPLALLLSACGEEEKPACCAIKPSATCEGELLGAGVTHAEVAILLGASEYVCPSDTLSEARIREIAPIWTGSDACKLTHGFGRLSALDAGLCPVQSRTDAPPLPPGVDINVATACAAGLVTRGITEPELWLVMGSPDGVCPNNGVTEKRLRDIIAKDWDAASCTQFSKEQMLHALDTGACGGDAG